MKENKNKISKIYDQIHTPESLKQQTFEKMKNTSKRKFNYSFVLEIAAVFIFTFAIGTVYYNNTNNISENNTENEQIAFETEAADLLHFKNMQELRTYLNSNYKETARHLGDKTLQFESVTTKGEMMDSAATEESATNSSSNTENDELNYYKTNTQEENVDEADIVKTDGKYIYYVANDIVYILKADNLNIEAKIENNTDENSNFYPRDLFIKDKKLIVIGNYTEYLKEQSDNENKFMQPVRNTTKAYIYNIENKNEPLELRQVDIDGNYDESRLVGNTLYLISTKYNNLYRPELKDSEILPVYYDTAISNEYRNIDCKSIVYLENSKNNFYKTIGALNINNDDEIKTETFLGYGDTVYCSEKNLYLTATNYSEGNIRALNSTEIYKFNISNGGLKYACKTTIEGTVNNQFSLDEYNNNLRIATTVEEREKAEKSSERTVNIGKTTTNNVLYILDENLEKIGELTDFGIEEKIYSVRFIKDVAYIVTFKQIDPLFVIDISDPRNPVLKGELEIPGYSSYLHPYDENHIIGIGYSVKSNGHGGVTNECVKISMFDISDLSNPKEIFNKTLGDKYSHSEVTRNHKMLMYDKERNLIGFPIYMKKNGEFQDSVVILKIDLEAKEFKIHSEYVADDFNYYMGKVIYIEDTVYLLSDKEIIAFDLNTLEEVANVKLARNKSNYYRTETMIIE